MRLAPTLVALSSLYTAARACLKLTGYHMFSDDILSLTLTDNGRQVCTYNGWYEHGYQVWFACIDGFYAWAGPNEQGGLLPIIAYAHDGRNFRLRPRLGLLQEEPEEIRGRENAWAIVGDWFC